MVPREIFTLTLLLFSIVSQGLTKELTKRNTYELTLTTFEPNELRTPEHTLPLYCKVTPQPRETVVYRWKDNLPDYSYFDEIETSPYVFYRPPYKHPKHVVIFCFVENKENRQILAQTNITLNIQGYLEARGETSITIKPPETLRLEAEIHEQYTVQSKSPLINMILWTRWTHNGLAIDVSNQLTLSLENTQNSTAGMYQLEVTHFFPSQVNVDETSTSGPISDEGTSTAAPVPTSLDPDDLYCSGVIVDAMQLYALFSPVKYHVNLLGSTEGSRQIKHYYKFTENNPMTIRIQIPLLQIRGLDLRLLSENKQLSYVLIHNGRILFDTSDSPFHDYAQHNSRFDTDYSINNFNMAEVTLTFASPPQSAGGTYEYQFYVHTDSIEQHLNESMCSNGYLNFIRRNVGMFRLLIGTATFDVKMTDLIVVNASKTYLTTDDEEGSQLSCSFAQRQDPGRGQLSWCKNEAIVATTNVSSLYLNTKDMKALFVNTYGTYTCERVATNGRRFAQTLHISEKASFSLQLQSTDDSLDCVRTSTDTIMQTLMSELRALLSQACDCEITEDHFTMATMSCDANMLTLSSDLVFSNSAGNVTASTVLRSAASALMGVRTFNEEMFTFDTSCPIRDAQGACVQGQAVVQMEVNQFTTLAISLLVIVCLLIGGAILTAVILCALKQRRGNKENQSIRSYSNPINGDHPLQQIPSPTQPLPVPSNETHADSNTLEPQAYSYPMVRTIVGRRMISNTGRRSNQVLTSPDSNIHSGGMNHTTAQHTESSEIESSAVEVHPNPAYTGSANKNLHNSALYVSIRQETTEPSGRASTREHIYDSPQFENSEEHEWEMNLEDSGDSYI